MLTCAAWQLSLADRTLLCAAVSAMDVDGSDVNFEDLEDDSDEDGSGESQLAPRAQARPFANFQHLRRLDTSPFDTLGTL